MAEGLEVDSEDISLSSRSRSTPPSVAPTFSCVRKVGSLQGFCVLASGKPLLSLGPDWGYFLCMVFCIATVDQVFAFLMYPSSPEWLKVTGIVVCTMLSGSYSLCALLDPGVALGGLSLNRSIEDLENKMRDLRFCGKCGVLRATETFHCDDCDVCITGYDHHCPFTGKCIGSGNLFPFRVFLSSILLTFVYAFLWVVSTAGIHSRH